MNELDRIDPNDASAIAESVVPYFDNLHKSEYLGFRACGFGVRDACQLVGVHQRTVNNWRKSDPEFILTENNALNSMRQNLAANHLNIRFTRNYALILEKDFIVIQKSTNDPDSLNKHEHEYLLKLRSSYSPQQLEVMRRLIGEDGGSGETFADWVIKLSRTKEELTIQRR